MKLLLMQHAPRARVGEKNVPLLDYRQGRTDEIAADATCAPRGEQGRKAFPYSIIGRGAQMEYVSKADGCPARE